jgi:hypothetical protein
VEGCEVLTRQTTVLFEIQTKLGILYNRSHLLIKFVQLCLVHNDNLKYQQVDQTNDKR